MSTIYIGERQSGKTTMLIEMSEKTGATIVVATYPMAKYIQLLAAQMGKKIPVPITVTNYIRLLASGGLGKSEKYLVDELQMMLSAMNVEAATVDCDCIEVLRGPTERRFVMAGIKMNVEFPTRLCEVNGKLGYFHRWEQWSKVVDASPLRGGHPGGQNGQVFGIVEFEDGVRRVGPSSIKFCDEENASLCALVKHNEALRKGEANAED